MQQDFFSQYLNSSTTEEEVKRAIGRLKLKKTPTGIDNLPKLQLKPPCSFSDLGNLFSICFEYSFVPRVCHKSILKPNPKSQNNDPRNPFELQGDKSQLCFFLSFMLNECMTTLLLFGNIWFVGFQKNRACNDRTFPLCVIVQAKIQEWRTIFFII